MELKRCPFCGEAVEISQYGGSGSFYIKHKYNEECILSRRELYTVGVEHFKTVEAITTAWNKRCINT